MPRDPLKRAHDLATVKDVFVLITGAMADFEARLRLAGVNLPVAEKATDIVPPRHMIQYWRRHFGKALMRELDAARVLLADTQEVVRNKAAEVQGWQNHAATLLTDNEHLRREAEHWRQSYERALEDGKHERQGLVQHVVDLKREGFGVQTVGTLPSEAQTALPPEIERAISMRDFDSNVTRNNRNYAMEQLRVRPDAASEIAKEILAGEQFETYDDSEVGSDEVKAA